MTKEQYIDDINNFWFGACYTRDVDLTEQQKDKVCITMLETWNEHRKCKLQ